MRIVMVSNGPADSGEADPIGRRQVPLLTALIDQGVSPVVVLLGDDGGLCASLRQAGIPVEVVATPLPPNGAALTRLPAAVRAVRAAIRRHRPDLVDGDEPMPAIAVGLAARGQGPVVVYRRHHAGGRRRLMAASRLAARLAARTVVSSETMRRCAAAQDGTSLDRIEVATSGAAEMLDPPAHEIAEARRALGVPEHGRLIAAVSRLRWEKGLDVLIEALDHLQDLDGLHLAVVGSGPEEDRLRAMAARRRVPVHFLGHRQDVACWLAAADVVAMPSRRESFGRVTLEAMAVGRPLVASQVGGLLEAIAHGETGLLVPPDDPVALATSLRTVLIDSPLAAGMGAAARRRYEAQFTIGHMAASWRDAWQRTLASLGRTA
jgi:glycosyltransferase involved in cell wall biosynthesis